MTLILVLDIIAVGLLISAVLTHGFERALPVATFLMVVFPNESQIHLPGLFDLTTQRLLVIVLLALYVTVGRSAVRGGASRQLPLKYLLTLQIAWMLLSAANSSVPAVSFKAAFSQVLDFFVPFFIIAKGVSTRHTVEKILNALVSGIIVCSIFGAVEAYSGWSVLSLFPALSSRYQLGPGAVMERGLRVQSTFPHPILFGGALAMAIPLALYLIPRANTSFQKGFLWVGLMLMFLNIYKTGSRGAWLALVLSLGLLLTFGRGRTRKYILSIALLASMVLVVRPGVWLSLSNTYSATNDPDSPEGTSYQWRYALYHLTFRELGKSPSRALWGYGPESFFYLGLTTEFYVNGEMHIVKADSCDSSVAALLIETGYVGFLLAAAVLLKAVWLTFRNFRRMPRPGNLLCLVLLANMTSFYFMMTNVAIYAWGQQAYMLWVIVVLATIYPRLYQARSVLPALAMTSAKRPQIMSGRLVSGV